MESVPICTPRGQQHTHEAHELHLTAHGTSSSAYVLLRDSEPDSTSLVGTGIEDRLQWPGRGRVAAHPSPETVHTCRLKVTAPAGHVVYVEVLETRLEIHRALIVHHEERDVKCPLNIFLPDTKSKPIYSANLCDVDPVAEVPLLPSELELTWKPPRRSDSSDFEMLTKDRMLLLTAVGKEATCRLPAGTDERNKYHTCMKIGWEPILCVSKDLMCNGQKNCPRGSTSSDEAEAICRAPQTLEDIARKFIQEFQLPLGFNEKWVESAKRQGDPTTTETSVAHKIVSMWKKIEVSTRRPSYPNADDHPKTHLATTTDTSTITIFTILSQYGPWGYLMLGMVICGSVLLLCGMWECCCRRPKPFLGSSTRRSNANHRGTNGGPTVLIINQEDGHRPPEYDDLDQPPLYSVLFPNNKVIEQGVTLIQMQDRRLGQEEEQSSTVRQSDIENAGPKDDETRQNRNASGSSEVSALDTGTTSTGAPNDS